MTSKAWEPPPKFIIGGVVPNNPVLTKNPALGVIFQPNWLFELQFPVLLTNKPPIEVLAKETKLFVHIEFWLTEKSAIGLVTVVIGPNEAKLEPHGFSALTLMIKLLGITPPIAPQELVLKVWIK